jgi:protein gp37
VSTVTKIEWTRSDDGTAGATWNPVTGCTKVSEGCDHCYAETFAERWRGVPGHPFEQGFDVRLWPERLTMPLRWRKPRRVFLNSMADLWHDAVDTDLIARVFAVITLAEKHTFQVLTKRPGRMHSLLADDGFWDRVRTVVPDYGPLSPAVESALDTRFLPNLWLGVSVESQKWASVRLDKLAATSAGPVRFASCEPLLGELDLRPWLGSGLDWVIVGGESGPKARPMHPAWAARLRDQCVAAGVPFFFKQWGTWATRKPLDWPAQDWARNPDRNAYVLPDGRFGPVAHRGGDVDHREVVLAYRVGKGRAGRDLDGRTWDEFPTPLAVRARGG